MTRSIESLDPIVRYLVDTVDAIKEHLDSSLPADVTHQWPDYPETTHNESINAVVETGNPPETILPAIEINGDIWLDYSLPIAYRYATLLAIELCMLDDEAGEKLFLSDMFLRTDTVKNNLLTLCLAYSDDNECAELVSLLLEHCDLVTADQRILDELEHNDAPSWVQAAIERLRALHLLMMGFPRSVCLERSFTADLDMHQAKTREK